jgi:hypothetical protein
MAQDRDRMQGEFLKAAYDGDIGKMTTLRQQGININQVRRLMLYNTLTFTVSMYL